MITVRTKSSSSVKEVVRFFNRNFPEAVLKVSHCSSLRRRLTLPPSSLSCLQERHHTKVQYQLKSERISLAQVFSKMEQVVEVLGLEDYSVSQTTLDNVSPCVTLCKQKGKNPIWITLLVVFFCPGVCQLCQEAEWQPGAAGGVAPGWWTVPPAAHPQPAEVSSGQHRAQRSDKRGAGGAGEWWWWRTDQLWRGKGETEDCHTVSVYQITGGSRSHTISSGYEWWRYRSVKLCSVVSICPFSHWAVFSLTHTAMKCQEAVQICELCIWGREIWSHLCCMHINLQGPHY